MRVVVVSGARYEAEPPSGRYRISLAVMLGQRIITREWWTLSSYTARDPLLLRAWVWGRMKLMRQSAETLERVRRKSGVRPVSDMMFGEEA